MAVNVPRKYKNKSTFQSVLYGLSTIVWKAFPFYFLCMITMRVEHFALTEPLITNSKRIKDQIPPVDNIENGCECGLRNDQNARIVGGVEAIRYEFPWLVRIKNFTCAGTLINDRMVLTAAHCFKRQKTGFTIIFHVVNSPSNKIPDVDAREYRVSHLIEHPDYVPLQPNTSIFGRGDVALLVLETPVNMTDPIFNPVCIPKANDKIDIFEGRNATIAGWGRTQREPPVRPPVLLKLRMELHAAETCRQKNVIRDYNYIICAGPFDRRGTAHGDSGGPLFMNLPSSRQIQIGVVSHGADRREEGVIDLEQISLFTSVIYYSSWIENHAKSLNAKWCKRSSSPT